MPNSWEFLPAWKFEDFDTNRNPATGYRVHTNASTHCTSTLPKFVHILLLNTKKSSKIRSKTRPFGRLTISRISACTRTPIKRLPRPNHTPRIQRPPIPILNIPRIASIRQRVKVRSAPAIRAHGHRISNHRCRNVGTFRPRVPDHVELIQHQTGRVEAVAVEERCPLLEDQSRAGTVLTRCAEVGCVAEDVVGLSARDGGVGRSGVGGVFLTTR